jgi:hypothetical protein
VIAEACTLNDLVSTLVEDEPDTEVRNDRFAIRCPELNLAVVLTSVEEARSLLKDIFSIHWQCDMDWDMRTCNKNAPNLFKNIDKDLEVNVWNSEEHQEQELNDDPTFDDQVFLGSAHLDKCKFETHTDNYLEFIEASLLYPFDLQNCDLAHCLPKPYGIITSATYDLAEFEGTMKEWANIYQFEVAARKHVLEWPEAKKNEVSLEALEYQVKKNMIGWLLSALVACCERHAVFQTVLLASHNATLLVAPNETFGAASPELLEALRICRKNMRLKQMRAKE